MIFLHTMLRCIKNMFLFKSEWFWKNITAVTSLRRGRTVLKKHCFYIFSGPKPTVVFSVKSEIWVQVTPQPDFPIHASPFLSIMLAPYLWHLHPHPVPTPPHCVCYNTQRVSVLLIQCFSPCLYLLKIQCKAYLPH